MDLTYINVPMNDGTIIRLPNVPMTKIHVQEIGDDIEANKIHESVKESLPEFSPDYNIFLQKKTLIKYNGQKRRIINNS